MENPFAELEGWWQDAYDDGNAGETVVLYEYRGYGGEDEKETERLEFRSADDKGMEATWRLEIDDSLESRWTSFEGSPQWHEDHPLLIPHSDRISSLSFAKPFDDPLRVWGAAARAHRAIVGDWFPLGRFFREKFVEDRFGILAEGPESLLLAYERALRDVGADVALSTNERTFDRYADAPPVSVITWGESYFVARSIRLTRLEV